MSNFYKRPQWKRKRAAILRRDEYLCRECKRYGKTTPATTVHHINQLEKYPELALVSINLLSLCPVCHGMMHDKTDGVLTKVGEQWKERVSPHLRHLKNNL